jgi:hypothetical protein
VIQCSLRGHLQREGRRYRRTKPLRTNSATARSCPTPPRPRAQRPSRLTPGLPPAPLPNGSHTTDGLRRREGPTHDQQSVSLVSPVSPFRSDRHKQQFSGARLGQMRCHYRNAHPMAWEWLDPTANVASAAVGGLIALGGSLGGARHQRQRDSDARNAEKVTKRACEIRESYARLLSADRALRAQTFQPLLQTAHHLPELLTEFWSALEVVELRCSGEVREHLALYAETVLKALPSDTNAAQMMRSVAPALRLDSVRKPLIDAMRRDPAIT